MSAPALHKRDKRLGDGKGVIVSQTLLNHAPRLCNFGSRSAGKEIAGAIVQGTRPALKEPLQGHPQSAASSLTVFRDGEKAPCSIRRTASTERSLRSANASCVRPFSRRNARNPPSKILVSSIPHSFLFKVSILLLTGNWAYGELARSASLSGRQQALSPGAHSDRVFEQFPAHILRMA